MTSRHFAAALSCRACGEDLSQEEHKERLLALYRALEGVGVVAEPFVMSETYFEETKEVIGGLAYPANKEGVLLYERP